MENKTAEEIYEENGGNNPGIWREYAIKAMKEYATQEIKKHLEIASNEAKLKLKKGRSIGFVQVVDKESITSIEIKLS